LASVLDPTDTGDSGNVGIIRSPLRATVLPDWERAFSVYHSLFINYEILMAASPHESRDDCIGDSGKDAEALKNAQPPWSGFIAAMAGAVGIIWGWYNLRRIRPSIMHFLVFLAGCILLVCGLIIVLPWSIRVH